MLKDKIISELDIVDVISQRVPLESSGQNYKGLCPFHQDNNPSMIVSPEKKIFKCFVCGEGGTVIDFVSKYENQNFNQTVKKLASELGIKDEEVVVSKKEYLLEDISSFYQTILKTSKLGAEAWKYLSEKRRIKPETIELFQLGFSPQGESLNKYLAMQIDKKNQYSQLEIEELEIYNKANKDFFNNRLIFPILNDQNTIVGFSGRIIEDGNVKYLNSRESSIFKKKEIIYNFNNYRESEDFVVIVEGFMDVIMATQHKIPNVMATMGVALTVEHIRKLKTKKIKHVYLGFDNDHAGKNATLNSGKRLMEAGIDVQILKYDQYKDLDEYLKVENNNWNGLKEHTQEFITFLIDNNPINTTDEKIEVINQVKPLLRQIKEKLKRNLITSEIAQKLEIDATFLGVEETTVVEEKIAAKPRVDQTPVGIDNREKSLFYLAANSFERFLEIDQVIREQKFEFLELRDEYKILEKLYAEKKVLNITITMDYIPILNEINKFGKESAILQSQLNGPFNIDSYLRENIVKKQTKLIKINYKK